jgi:hypothetical protein
VDVKTVGTIAAVGIGLGLSYLLASRFRNQRRVRVPEPWRVGPHGPAAWRWGLGIAGATVLVGFGLLAGRNTFQYQAVKEKRGELLQAAARSLGCPSSTWTVVEEGPRRARVDGCGQSLTLFWRRQRHAPAQWLPGDPNCRVSYLGCELPCD